MPRHRKAWFLLVALALWCAQSVLPLAMQSGAKSCCASASCCGKTDCPMRSHHASMPKTCPMGSKSAKSPGMKNCPCSVSSNEAPINFTAHVDFRFDLPPTALAQEAPVSYQSPIRISSNIMAGFISPPEQPPKVLA